MEKHTMLARAMVENLLRFLERVNGVLSLETGNVTVQAQQQ